MKLKFVISIVTLVFFTSCQNDIKAKFEITNQTANLIDSINIKAYDHQANPNYLKLESGQSKTYWLDMTDLPKVDGDYLLTYKDKKLINRRVRFGYFTNGFSLEKVTKINIQEDTVLIDQIYDDY